MIALKEDNKKCKYWRNSSGGYIQYILHDILNIFNKEDDSQGLRVEHYVANDVDIDAKKKHSPMKDSPIHFIVKLSNPLQEV